MKKITCSLISFFTFLMVSEGRAQNSVDVTVPVTTTITVSPPTITFTWDTIPGAVNFIIYRKTKSAYSWGPPRATLTSTATHYTDTAVIVGGDYEYRIYKSGSIGSYTYIYAGIQTPAIETRGAMVLIVDSTFSDSLSTELNTLELDLIGDGWKVIRHDVSPSDAPPAIKSLIWNDYLADPTHVNSVFLFGHVPVPYSGDINPDGHPDHLGAWPADVYYADLDTNWTDVTVNDAAASRPQNQNIPGDGKFDQSLLPGPNNAVELQVGRVDLSNMPAFALNEQELLRQYLVRDHNYKHKNFVATRRGLIDDNFGYFSGEAFAASGWRNFFAMFGKQNVFANDYLTTLDTADYICSYGCGGGSYTSCGGIGVTSDFTIHNPKSVFTMLFGSYFGDWDSQNNFLRAPLAASGWTLTSCWSGRPYWIMDHMELGECIGYSARLSQNNNSTYLYNYAATFSHIALMGDPSLRLHTVYTADSLTATPLINQVALQWNASPDSVLGYYAYRLDTVSGFYTRINPALITGLNYIDSFPNNNRNYYMVRAVKNELSGGGSYYNLSQGVFDTTVISLSIGIAQIPETNLEINLYPNPANNQISISIKDIEKSSLAISIFDLLGRPVSLDEKVISINNSQIVISTENFTPGIYSVEVDSGALTGRRKFVVLR